jgi:hypothetical protein
MWRDPGYTRWEPPGDDGTNKESARGLDTRACVSLDETRDRSDSQNRITGMKSLYVLGKFRASRSVLRLQTPSEGAARNIGVG